ncbi:MAG: XTP/dITP diphosphatase [Anaerolineae bacterium]
MHLMQILIATTNAGKLAEYQQLLPSLPARWLSPDQLPYSLPEVEETGETFLANALLKAVAYAKLTGLPALSDDSGLMVDALDGAPGVYSARYAPTVAERNIKLLNALADVPEDRRNAQFVCVVAFAAPAPEGMITLSAEGRVNGRIAFSPRGANGFGYDPLFLMADGRTLAEYASAEKHVVSHRGRALARLRPLLEAWFAAYAASS